MGSNCPEIALGCPGVPSEITDRAGQHFAGEPTLDVEVMNALLLLIVLGFLLALERRTLPPKDQMKRPSLLCCYQLVMSLDLPGNLVPVPLRLFRYCCSPLVGTPIQKELSCGRCRLSSPQIIYVCLSVSRNSLRSSQVRQETLLQVRPPVVQFMVPTLLFMWSAAFAPAQSGRPCVKFLPQHNAHRPRDTQPEAPHRKRPNIVTSLVDMILQSSRIFTKSLVRKQS